MSGLSSTWIAPIYADLAEEQVRAKLEQYHSGADLAGLQRLSSPIKRMMINYLIFSRISRLIAKQEV